jgi:hypothetical protein
MVDIQISIIEQNIEKGFFEFSKIRINGSSQWLGDGRCPIAETTETLEDEGCFILIGNLRVNDRPATTPTPAVCFVALSTSSHSCPTAFLSVGPFGEAHPLACNKRCIELRTNDAQISGELQH